MATDKPRITITLEPESYSALSRLSDLDGAPMARIVSSLVADATPGIVRLADSLLEARRVASDVRLSFRRGVVQAEEELSPALEAARSQLDMFGDHGKSVLPSLEIRRTEDRKGKAMLRVMNFPGFEADLYPEEALQIVRDLLDGIAQFRG